MAYKKKAAPLRAIDYRLTNDKSGISQVIKSGRKGNLLVFDEKEQRSRAIKHCPNQKSIYVDEQNQFAIVEPIVFLYGQLHVKANDVITQEFLASHPSNSKNSETGGWFEEINEEQEAKEGTADTELKASIISKIIEVSKEKDGLHQLSAVVAVLEGSFADAQKMGLEELKRSLYNEVDSDMRYFLDEENKVTIFNDRHIQRKYLTLKGLNEQIIKKSNLGRTMMWKDTEKVILTAPRSVDLVEHFAEFLGTDEGMLVAEEMANRS